MYQIFHTKICKLSLVFMHDFCFSLKCNLFYDPSIALNHRDFKPIKLLKLPFPRIFWHLNTKKFPKKWEFSGNVALEHNILKRMSLIITSDYEFRKDIFDLIIYFGTILILCQQRNWVDGVREMAIFADVQCYLCWRWVGQINSKNVLMLYRDDPFDNLMLSRDEIDIMMQ